MIVVTGGFGFIGRNLVKELERRGYVGVLVVDTKTESLDTIHRWLMDNVENIDCIFHLGAITDTTEMSIDLFDAYNVMSSIFIWNLCATYGIPLIYASSAATYGDGELGFDDDKIFGLKPLNPYGRSKQQFDEFVMKSEIRPPHWYGLKFFNVYGHGEANKGKMASVVYQKYQEIKENESYVDSCVEDDGSFFGKLCVKLFKSHNPNHKDGEQMRDFIYIDDVVNICIFLMQEKPISGIYNVGTGKARTFNDLVKAVFKSLGIKQNISYIDIPKEIRENYQYFTEAKIGKLRSTGYNVEFHELEQGIEKYINKLKYENR
jgi:ADP-L-glycero-D-manno-heptose 6-epimerase